MRILYLGLICSLLAFAQLACAQESSPPARAVQPEVGGANLPAQPIGPNDLIAVTVYDAPELSRTVRVGGDGLIRLPMLKERLQVEHLVPADVESLIANALKREQILVDPFVTVTIAEYHSRPISVSGAVRKPLVFQAESQVTLLEALARAEGLTENAGPEILVTTPQTDSEGNKISLTRRIPARELLDAADPSLNVKLSGGEEIRVPEAAKIFVVGSVRKPGAFPVHDGEQVTVLQTLALAEGLTQYAGKEAYIYRREGSGAKNEIPISLKKILNHKAPDVPLLANDILYIPDSTGKKALDRVLTFGSTAGATALIYH